MPDSKHCDTTDFNRTFYGILNKQGAFWTPLIFDSEAKARKHVEDFWGNQRDKREECMRTFKFVPVKARIRLSKPPHNSVEE